MSSEKVPLNRENNGQYYSLFPAKKKHIKGRMAPEEVCKSGNSVKILSRGMALPVDQNVNITSMKWPDLMGGPSSPINKDRGKEAGEAKSFADMVRRPPMPLAKNKNDVPNVKHDTQKSLKPVDKTVQKKPQQPDNDAEKKTYRHPKESSQDNVALSSIAKKKKTQRRVVNQISASTFNNIGRSDDESKYVSSRAEEPSEKEAKRKTSIVRHELEVEFKEDRQLSSDDDFEVEFNADAAMRSSNNVVNKISAMTFQQIGNTSETESYVMKPKSWSSIVGKGLKANNSGLESNKSTENNSIPTGEPLIQDKIRSKLKNGEEITPEEREILRQKRRDRRKNDKERKKKEREEEKRRLMLAPQTSKLRFISSDILDQVNRPTNIGQKESFQTDKGIKFMDEEYPDLGIMRTVPARKEKVISKEIRNEEGKLVSDRESNSEWETEDEAREEGVMEAKDENKDEKGEVENISVVTCDEPTTFSYSSILKSNKSAASIKTRKEESSVGLRVDNKSEEQKMKPEANKKPTEQDKKKVKKKDPIEFDLMSALQVKKQPKKNAQVLGGKIKKEISKPVVRNQLDSSAPAKKRGKEREGGKKKKKTLMKKIILADREKRKAARDEAEQRRIGRIKAGVILKPLPRKEDETEVDPIIENEVQEDKILKEIAALDICQEPTVIVNETPEEPDKIPEMTVEEKAKAVIHSRKFRTYCNHILSPELDTVISSLMSDLIRFQDKQHAKDPVKAKAKRRYVVGLREVGKFLKVKKVQCLVLAPDLEKVQAEGGLDDAVLKLVMEAGAQDPPVSVVFGLARRRLGKLCLKKVPVSCIGIMNYQGSDENYRKMQELVVDLKDQYQTRLTREIEYLSKGTTITDETASTSQTLRSSSRLSEKAPAFVPSGQFYSGSYSDYYNPYYYSGQYYGTEYYQDLPEMSWDDYQQQEVGSSEVWQGMVDILRD